MDISFRLWEQFKIALQWMEFSLYFALILGVVTIGISFLADYWED